MGLKNLLSLLPLSDY